jgi:hypothetical protein
MKIMVYTDDCQAVNVTEAVKVLYDLAINSMDFGSGMWSAEDAVPVAELAKICGFEQREEVQKYIDKRLAWQDTYTFLLEHPEAGRPGYRAGHRTVPHDHVYTRAGECMWRFCYAVDSGT